MAHGTGIATGLMEIRFETLLRKDGPYISSFHAERDFSVLSVCPGVSGIANCDREGAVLLSKFLRYLLFPSSLSVWNASKEGIY